MEETVTNEVREVINTSKVMTFDKLMKGARDIQNKCHDYNVSKVSLKNLAFSQYGNLMLMPDGGEIMGYPLSRFALSQLGSKLGVPASYLSKCIDSGRLELAADNINSWVDDYNKDLFIREYDGHIRGILSSKYSVCDTPDILDVLNSTVNMNRYRIKGYFMNEERLHLRLVSKEMLPIEGEDLFPSIFVDSSDVGRNVLIIHFGIYKQVCTNGLMISKGSGKLFEQKHIGIKSEELYEGLVASLKNVDFLCEHAVELVEKASNNVMKYRVTDMSPEDFEEFVAQIKGTTRLSTEGASKVIDLMQTKYGDSRWGYINSITEVAQDYTLERRLELERIAGQLLDVA